MHSGMETAKKTISVGLARSGKFAGVGVHLIGVGGCGMRALAHMLIDRGAQVSGSDLCDSGSLLRLRDSGAGVYIGQGPENIPKACRLVVHSAAIHPDNPELLAAKDRDVQLVKYSEMLGQLMDEQEGVAVAGTHGKSTTSAMVAFALCRAGVDPSYIIGATVEQLGGASGAGTGKHFVAEACEFDRSFLNLRPKLAAILNIEEDHLDCFKDLSAIIEAFRAFAGQVADTGVLIANGEDRNVTEALSHAACEVQTFGMTDGCTWAGANVTSDRGRARMDVMFDGSLFCHIAMKLPGKHNAYNALAATALLHHAGLAGEQIAKLLGEFEGTRRRMTLKGQARGITVIDDYAHHPTEIQVTLKALRDYYAPKRLWCVFQPHQHSRTRFLLKDFARCFGQADHVLVPEIYFVRDSAREKDCISAEDLVAQVGFNGGAARYLGSFDEIADTLKKELAPGDLVVTMGAGNIWEVADEIVRWI